MPYVKGAFGAAVFFFLAQAPAAQAQYVSLTGTTVEHFDTLAASGTSSTLPAGWHFVEAGSNANGTYAADPTRSLATMQVGAPRQVMATATVRF